MLQRDLLLIECGGFQAVDSCCYFSLGHFGQVNRGRSLTQELSSSAPPSPSELRRRGSAGRSATRPAGHVLPNPPCGDGVAQCRVRTGRS